MAREHHNLDKYGFVTMKGGETVLEKMIAPVLALTPKEASELSGIGEKLVRQLCHRPDFPAFKVGTHIHIPYSDFRDWLSVQAADRVGFAPVVKVWKTRNKPRKTLGEMMQKEGVKHG